MLEFPKPHRLHRSRPHGGASTARIPRAHPPAQSPPSCAIAGRGARRRDIRRRFRGLRRGHSGIRRAREGVGAQQAQLVPERSARGTAIDFRYRRVQVGWDALEIAQPGSLDSAGERSKSVWDSHLSMIRLALPWVCRAGMRLDVPAGRGARAERRLPDLPDVPRCGETLLDCAVRWSGPSERIAPIPGGSCGSSDSASRTSRAVRCTRRVRCEPRACSVRRCHPVPPVGRLCVRGCGYSADSFQVLNGCLEWGGADLAEQFIVTTHGKRRCDA